ncbi:MAG: hypothetical protein K2P84_07275 [Undibacterium sp.]|nr:hypothetical protein [Undibacterium sp.]
MIKFKHHALLWLLILAIPLQGLAAASMMLCATEHHQVSTMQNAQSVQASERKHDAPVQSYQGHQHHVQVHEADDHASESATTHQHTSKDKCSACSACCVGAVILTSYLASPISRPASEKIDTVFSSHVGHISDSLERPPRA